MKSNLKAFFSPTAIAVIGASRKKGSLGRMLIEKLIQYEYEGAIYPVNPKAEAICGLPVISNIAALPAHIELAVVLVPKRFVFETITALGEKGIKNAIVITAGFKEVGGKGIEREKALIDLVKKYKMRIVGPNCMGLINTHPDIRMNCSFSPTEPFQGNIAFISQSGALGVAVLEMAKEMNLGFSIFASTGNKADLKDIDFLRHCADDKESEVIVFYMESIEKADEFMKSARNVYKSKPIIAIKAGKTSSGAAAAASHTGALASADAVSDAFLRACGIIRADSVKEMFDYSQAFVSQPLLRGKNIGIITNAGGPAIMATDALEENGLIIANLNEKTKIKLKEFLPEEASVKNPVDMIASATHDIYAKTTELLLADENVDGLVVIIVRPPVDTTPKKIARELSEMKKRFPDKPVLCVVMAQADEEVDLAFFRRHNLPVYQYPENAAKTLRKMAEYKELLNLRRNGKKGTDIPVEKILALLEKARSENREFLNQVETFSIFEAMDFPLPRWTLAENLKSAIEFKKKTKSPIVMKIEANAIQHKSDIGGVKVGLKEEEEVVNAWHDIMSKAGKITDDIDGMIMQEMADVGTEIALGIFEDPNYGKMLMFGLGGIFIEVIKDVRFWPADISKDEAEYLIEQLQYKKLLEGARGKPVVDKKWLAEIITKIGKLATEIDDIIEMDINPFSVNTNGQDSKILDGRIRIKII